MKFGKRLREQSHPAWAKEYLPYEALKTIVDRIADGEAAKGQFDAEGEFLTQLLNSIAAVDAFYAEREAEYAKRLGVLAQILSNPNSWLLKCPELELDQGADVDFPRLVGRMEAGVHAPATQREALDAFLALCADIDLLRKFSVLNALGVTKICKKHANIGSDFQYWLGFFFSTCLFSVVLVCRA